MAFYFYRLFSSTFRSFWFQILLHVSPYISAYLVRVCLHYLPYWNLENSTCEPFSFIFFLLLFATVVGRHNTYFFLCDIFNLSFLFFLFFLSILSFYHSTAVARVTYIQSVFMKGFFFRSSCSLFSVFFNRSNIFPRNLQIWRPYDRHAQAFQWWRCRNYEVRLLIFYRDAFLILFISLKARMSRKKILFLK